MQLLLKAPVQAAADVPNFHTSFTAWHASYARGSAGQGFADVAVCAMWPMTAVQPHVDSVLILDKSHQLHYR